MTKEKELDAPTNSPLLFPKNCYIFYTKIYTIIFVTKIDKKAKSPHDLLLLVGPVDCYQKSRLK